MVTDVEPNEVVKLAEDLPGRIEGNPEPVRTTTGLADSTAVAIRSETGDSLLSSQLFVSTGYVLYVCFVLTSGRRRQKSGAVRQTSEASRSELRLVSTRLDRCPSRLVSISVCVVSSRSVSASSRLRHRRRHADSRNDTGGRVFAVRLIRRAVATAVRLS